MAEPKYVVAKNERGLGLAQLVEEQGGVAVIRRLRGGSRARMFSPVSVPRAHVIREATARELALGHPL